MSATSATTVTTVTNAIGGISSVTVAERSHFLAYERERTRRLLSIIVPTGSVLSIIAILVAAVSLLVQPRLDVSIWINNGITLLLVAVFCSAWLLERQDHLDLARGLVIVGGSVGVAATVAVACFSQGLTPLSFIQVASLLSVLVVVGMVGNWLTIVGAAVVLNAVTLVILLAAPRPAALDALIRQQLPLLVSVSLTYEWGVAALMIATRPTYRQTLRTLGIAYERAQQLDNLKSQFITHVNHELRTPIMTLQGYIEYLRLGRETLPAGEQDAALQRASRTADTLVALLSQILDIRRLETHQSFIPEPVRIRDALDAALALVDPRLGGGIVRDLHLAVPDELMAWGDPLWLQQILTNLISNALKYSAPGTPLQISAQPADERSSGQGRLTRGPRRRGGRAASDPSAQVEIVVRDFGQGIPPDQIPLLFNRFVRLPRDLASNVPGSGLGLYLCRVFAEAMGGRIWVESTGVAGEGSAFHLRLSLATRGSATASERNGGGAGLVVAPRHELNGDERNGEEHADDDAGIGSARPRERASG